MSTLGTAQSQEKTPVCGVTPDLKELTKTEKQVIRALARGGDNKSAAMLLDRSVKTIENTLVAIHRKTGLSTLRCVLLAERQGLLEGVA